MISTCVVQAQLHVFPRSHALQSLSLQKDMVRRLQACTVGMKTIRNKKVREAFERQGLPDLASPAFRQNIEKRGLFYSFDTITLGMSAIMMRML